MVMKTSLSHHHLALVTSEENSCHVNPLSLLRYNFYERMNELMEKCKNGNGLKYKRRKR